MAAVIEAADAWLARSIRSLEECSDREFFLDAARLEHRLRPDFTTVAVRRDGVSYQIDLDFRRLPAPYSQASAEEFFEIADRFAKSEAARMAKAEPAPAKGWLRSIFARLFR